MEKTDLVLFGKDSIRNVLEDFDFKIVKEGKIEKIFDSKMNIIKCHTCENELHLSKVGTVAQGSRLVFCDNPLCFATWVAENKIK